MHYVSIHFVQAGPSCNRYHVVLFLVHCFLIRAGNGIQGSAEASGRLRRGGRAATTDLGEAPDVQEKLTELMDAPAEDLVCVFFRRPFSQRGPPNSAAFFSWRSHALLGSILSRTIK